METVENSAQELNKNPIHTSMVEGIAKILPIRQFETEPETALRRAILIRGNQGVPVPQCVWDDTSLDI